MRVDSVKFITTFYAEMTRLTATGESWRFLKRTSTWRWSRATGILNLQSATQQDSLDASLEDWDHNLGPNDKSRDHHVETCYKTLLRSSVIVFNYGNSTSTHPEVSGPHSHSFTTHSQDPSGSWVIFSWHCIFGWIERKTYSSSRANALRSNSW